MISNANNSSSINRKAEKNYNDCIKFVNNINDLGKNENIISNIENMNSKLNALIENGMLTESHPMYDVFKENINEAIKFQSKPFEKRGIEDIILFYNTYNNFNDIYKRINGGE